MQRLMLLLLLLGGLVTSPIEIIACNAPAAPGHCECCADCGRPCPNMAMQQTPCSNLPQQADRNSQALLKAQITPVLFVTGTIYFSQPSQAVTFLSKGVDLIPSPPPLELSCIRLI